MQRALILIVYVMSIVMLRGQSSQAQQSSPREVVDQFCKLDEDGERLSTSSRKDLIASVFSDARGQIQSPEVTVVTSFSARELSHGRDAAAFAIEYLVLGRLDSSLHFTRLQGAYTSKPISQSENIALIRSDTYFDLRSDGQWQQVKGAPEWRIKHVPSEPHVSVGAAMAYLRSIGYRSKDPMLKMNAQKTFAELQNLYQSQTMVPHLAQPIPQTPLAILSQFAAMETDGAGLIPGGTRQLEALFVRPREWQRDRIHVAKSYVVKDTPFSGNKAELYVEYAALGDLDSSLRFRGAAATASTVREEFKLIFDNRYSLPARGNAPAKEFLGPSRWRINEGPTEQWLTVSAAIRYVTKMRDSALDPTVKNNAQQTLDALAHYR